MKRQVALDTETTGKSDDGTPGEHRIIEVGCVEIIDRKLTGRRYKSGYFEWSNFGLFGGCGL